MVYKIMKDRNRLDSQDLSPRPGVSGTGGMFLVRGKKLIEI